MKFLQFKYLWLILLGLIVLVYIVKLVFQIIAEIINEYRRGIYDTLTLLIFTVIGVFMMSSFMCWVVDI